MGKKRRFTTLIVEDNPSFREMLYGLLCERFPRMLTFEAGNGAEGWRKVTSEVPDLVFMDIRLPDENGLDLAKRIRASYPHTSIIVLTSYDLPEYRKAAAEYGADHFFSKGTSNIDEILKAVESLGAKYGLDEGCQTD